MNGDWYEKYARGWKVNIINCYKNINIKKYIKSDYYYLKKTKTTNLHIITNFSCILIDHVKYKLWVKFQQLVEKNDTYEKVNERK